MSVTDVEEVSDMKQEWRCRKKTRRTAADDRQFEETTTLLEASMCTDVDTGEGDDVQRSMNQDKAVSKGKGRRRRRRAMMFG